MDLIMICCGIASERDNANVETDADADERH